MLRSVKEMTKYGLAAKDGVVGRIGDFLFDRARWAVRWVVPCGASKLKRTVLVSPVIVGEPDWKLRLLPVRLSLSEMEKAPPIEGEAATISRQYEKRWFDCFALPYYWGNTGLWGKSDDPALLFRRQAGPEPGYSGPVSDPQAFISARGAIGCRVQAVDEELGRIEDLVIDVRPWRVRYLVVSTRRWLPRREVLVAPDWVLSISPADRRVAVDLTGEAVKGSPTYDPRAAVNRSYEERLYDYYGRPVYWER